MTMLKVFATAADVTAMAAGARIIERYPAFVVAEVEKREQDLLETKFPTEDMTDQYRLPIGGASVDPLLAKRTRGRAAKSAALPRGPHHYVVQFIGPVKQAWLVALRKAGATLRNPMSGFAYVVRANETALEQIRTLPSVRWVGHLPHADRAAPGVADNGPAPTLPRRRTIPGMLTLEAFDSTDLARIGKAARGLGFEVIATDKRARLLTLQSEGTPKQQRDSARALSAVHGVRYIRHRVVPRTCNNVATGVMGNKYVAASSNGLKLAGRGEVIAVCDTGLDSGDPENIHPDFAGRVRAVKSYPITPDWNAYVTNPGANDGPADLDSGHGTHVAGSVLGDGSASAALEQPIQGHAPKAMLVFQAVEQEMKWKPSAPADLRSERYALAGLPVNLMPLFRYAYDQGARIHSNSWGGGDPGAYDDQCAQFDEFVWKHKDMCFVIAAGNDGTDDDGDGRVNPGSVSSPGTAKNCITVGACENLRPEFNAERYGDWWPEDFPTAPYKIDPMANDSNQIVPFSSRGPTTDGRFKPDVVAPGTFILSTRSTQLAPNNFAWAALPGNKLYFHMGGTSMATPLTSGAVALIREYLRTKRQMTSPSAALLKAVIVAGAERLPKTAPTGTVLDNDQGFGRVNLDRSLKSLLMVLEGAGLKTGQQASATVRVTAANKTLRIALAYSDYPGKGLVNNLNLIVTSPSGKRYVGNQRSSSTGPLAMDAKNNVELVQVAKAAKGTWTIEIVASNVMRGPQDYALAAAQV